MITITITEDDYWELRFLEHAFHALSQIGGSENLTQFEYFVSLFDHLAKLLAIHLERLEILYHEAKENAKATSSAEPEVAQQTNFSQTIYPLC